MRLIRKNNLLNTFNRYVAFTLAEVLITLAIIGVVAALTVPTLISKYQKRQYVSQLKKLYTETNQAISQITNQNGCRGDLACTGFFKAENTAVQFGDELSSHMNILTNCRNEANKGCFAAYKANYDGTGTVTNVDGLTTTYKFILSDGSSILFGSKVTDCVVPSSYSNGATKNMTQVCGRLLFDTNGPKKGPNALGRDIFSYWVTNGRGALLYPGGGADDHYGSTTYWWKGWTPNVCTDNNSRRMGYYCAGRIMEENWEMNY